MSYPFGSTSLGSYIVWAHEVAGCTCQSGYGGRHGSAFVKLTAPSGKRVYVIGVSQKERLTSSMLNYLDRRLGLISPFERSSPEA